MSPTLSRITFFISISLNLVLALILLSYFVGSPQKTSVTIDQPDLATEDEHIGYSLGIMVGRQLHQDVSSLDIDSFSLALKDLYSGQQPQLDDQQIADVLDQLQRQLMQQAQQEAESAAKENLARGQAFLEENAAKSGVKVTDSGLQYRVIKQGKGLTPTASTAVKVHYEGSLIDGTVFDSSYQRGEPVDFRVSQVIAGWQEALQLMPEGSEWMVYIPSDLAYGPAGAGGNIGPNAALIFKIELLEVKD